MPRHPSVKDKTFADALFALHTALSTWSPKFKCASRTTPKYLKLVTFSMVL